MENIPVEILTLIFRDYLCIEEILNCGLVSKRWYSIAKGVKLKDLIFYNGCYIPVYNRWFRTYTHISHLHRLNIVDNKLSKFIIENAMFTCVKRLYIFSASLMTDNRINNAINSLEKLEQLEFNYCVLLNYRINLPNLKTLNIEKSFLHTSFQIDCPLLENLKIIDSEMLKIKILKPKSIKYFMVDKFCFGFVKQFESLEYLYCEQFKSLTFDVFGELTRLRECHIYDGIDAFNNILEHSSQKDELKLFYNGVKFTGKSFKIDKTKEDHNFYRKVLDKNEINFIADNYKYASNLIPFFKSVNYNFMEEKFSLNIPVDLSSRLVDLTLVKLSGRIKYPKQLEQFLRNLKKFNSLETNFSALDQTFFDNLPHFAPYFDDLKINETEKLDICFLFRFKDIRMIKINQNLDLSFVRTSLENFKLNFVCIEFRYKDQIVSISYYLKPRFELALYISGEKHKLSNLNELFYQLVCLTAARI